MTPTLTTLATAEQFLLTQVGVSPAHLPSARHCLRLGPPTRARAGSEHEYSRKEPTVATDGDEINMAEVDDDDDDDGNGHVTGRHAKFGLEYRLVGQ